MFLLPFQDLRFDGNRLARVPTEVLAGPEALQNLQLQDNIIGERERRERYRAGLKKALPRFCDCEVK